MKHDPMPMTGRALARHCPELLRDRHSAGGDLAGPMMLAAERIARELARRLPRLLGGDGPAVICAKLTDTTGAGLAEGASALAAYSLLSVGPHEVPVLVTVDAEAVFGLLDRTFGGKGEPPDPLPASFPMSSELLVARLEAIVGDAIATGLALAGEQPVRSLRRDHNIAQLAPFAAVETLSLMRFGVSEPGKADWSMVLAFPATQAPLLFAADALPLPPRSAGEADPAAEPYAEMPLSLEAVLVDMVIPLSRLAALEAGDVFPVAVARSIPLCIRGRPIARGTIGSLDDRVAIQLTEAFG